MRHFRVSVAMLWRWQLQQLFERHPKEHGPKGKLAQMSHEANRTVNWFYVPFLPRTCCLECWGCWWVAGGASLCWAASLRECPAPNFLNLYSNFYSQKIKNVYSDVNINLYHLCQPDIDITFRQYVKCVEIRYDIFILECKTASNAMLLIHKWA